MKKVIKLLCIFTVTSFFLVSCGTDNGLKYKEEPTTGWVEFLGPGSATTIPFSTERLSIPVDINVPDYRDGLTINYSIVPVAGNVSSILSTGTSVFADFEATRSSRTVDIVINFGDLTGLTEVVVFDVVLDSVESDTVTLGIDSDSILSFRVSTPCPIAVGTSFTGTTALYNGSAAPNGYAIVATPVLGSPFTYSLDTSWGPNFISTLCGGCVPPGDYPGPITLQIDPADFSVTLLSGGEPSGVGNTFDIPYTIAGGGTYDSCNDVFNLNLTQSLLTTGGVPGTVDLILEGN